MSGVLQVSSSPHIRSGMTTDKIMRIVAAALLPACCVGVYVFGWRALMLILVSVFTCVAAEAVYEKCMKKKITVRDGSAVVTGMLLAMNLPASAPWWIAVLGGVFAIIIVKQLFGGLGQNFMNPALGARCFLLISFTGRMTNFAMPAGTESHIVDTVSGATPLAALKAGESVDLMSLFLGTTKGTIGETSALAILLGALVLVVLKIIDLRIPLTYIVTYLIFAVLFGGHGLDVNYLLGSLLGGGLMLGAWFMATDYVTGPITKNGKYVYGVILGILTGIFRIFGASAEGVSYAIIFSNILVPLIERVTLPRGFGRGKKA